MNGEIWFQLPPQSSFEWIIVGLTAFFAGSLLIFGMLTVAEQNDRFLSFRKKYRFEKVPLTIVAIGFALLLIIAALFFSAIAASFVVVFGIISPNIETPTPNLGGGALLTALIGGPFVIWRTMVAQWTVDHQRESLFNEKLNAASKDLAAWREVTKVVGRGRDQRVLTTREPDLVTRATAIDRLYGLIKERPEDKRSETANRIAAMLSLYVREHTVQVGNKIPDVPPVPVPENAAPDELREWAKGLKVGRSDLQKAAQVIGGIRDIPGVKLEDNTIDLRGANLQAMNLSGLNFGKGLWDGAQTQGADLGFVQMQGAKLSSAQMQGANLSYAHMQGAKLWNAQMQGADLRSAQIQGADLSSAQTQGADLSYAQMQGAKLSAAQMQRADLSFAQMQGAILSFAQMQGAKLVTTRMQGAKLWDVQMQGAILVGAQMQGAAFADMFVNEINIYRHTKDVFGDGTNEIDPALFPTDGDPWPDHWPTESLDWDEFDRQWRTWVAENHPYVLQYLPYHVRDA